MAEPLPGGVAVGRRAPAFLSSFATPGFGWIWLSILIANSGRYGLVLVAGSAAYDLGHSALWSSLVATVILLPTLAVGPLAGGLADRLNRPVLMTAGMLIAALAAAAGAVAFWLGTLTLPWIVSVVLVAGTGSAVQGPAGGRVRRVPQAGGGGIRLHLATACAAPPARPGRSALLPDHGLQRHPAGAGEPKPCRRG